MKEPLSDYWGSNYGRVISTKQYGQDAKPYELLGGGVRSDGHIAFSLSTPKLIIGGEMVRDAEVIVIGAQRIVGDLFLDDYYPDLWRRNAKDVHHLDFNPANNKWDNLIFLPKYLHRFAHFIKSYYLYNPRTRRFEQLHPYEIKRQTGYTLDAIIYPVKDYTDFKYV